MNPISLYTNKEIPGISFCRVSLLVDNSARKIFESDWTQVLDTAKVPAAIIGKAHKKVDNQPACIQSNAENKSVYIMPKRKVPKFKAET